MESERSKRTELGMPDDTAALQMTDNHQLAAAGSFC